ncbi:MAG: site-specific DNA-methyltransferase [Elusimicrobia bacterium]|nr:site-specific DNA-methyltransferase [Elusimicrobiota bacterium]
MAKIEITKTELVWPGKYNEDGTLKEVPRVSLPFQVIETVNESRATREAKKTNTPSLFDFYQGKEGDTFEAGWRNKLIWGENLLVMGSLLEKFAGKIDLIYIDPPFATGADFSFMAEIGEKGIEVEKEQSAIEEKAYRDTWGRGDSSFLSMMSQRLVLMRDLLTNDGSLFLHCDWHIGHYLKSICDDVFGRDRMVNEIAWCYTGPGSPGMRQFNRKHDTIFWYAKSAKWCFNANEVRVAHHEKTLDNFKKGLKGSGFVADTYDLAEKGKVPEDWWEMAIAARSPVDGVMRTGYATEKPWPLLDRIVKAASKEGQVVADFFCGSGTTLAVAERLGRRWIGCDLGRWGTHVSRKRLLGIENCKPFEVLNLGKYERQYWQGVTFGNTKEKPLTEQALFEYLAFILKLYSARPVAGMAHLHGKKGKAMIHIGAVDAPVTISEIDAAVDECAKLKQSELHVLGWEWEMGLYDLMVEASKKKGVKLLLLQIPREVMEQQAAAKGDVRFFELAYLEAEIKKPKKLTAQVELKDFVIPNTDLIPEEVRSKVKKWSDFIDYWSVDWDFQNDTFMQGWVAYRTRKERSLPLACDPHNYEKPGKYRILVKVIDIFGNDTSQAFDVEVK